MKKKIIPLVFTVTLLLFMLSLSIALPIYCRFFYFAHIKPLGLDHLKWSVAEIKDAYNELLNYLTLPWCEFGTGVFKYSEDGAAHFADCRALFMLDTAVLLASAIGLIVMIVLKIKKVIPTLSFENRSSVFYAGVLLITIPIVIGGLASINFDVAFEIFHKIFFPGKDNYVFYPSDDQIILVLPVEFFMNCAIFIASGLLLFSLACIVFEIIRTKKNFSF